MDAIRYLMVRSSINWLKKLKEKPAVAIITGLFIFFMLITFISAISTDMPESKADINILYSIFFVLSLFFISTAFYGGLSTGTTFFNMSDVNIMFTSPISSNLVLIYGVVKQMGRSLFLSIFMLFQIGNLKNSFGLSLSKSLFIIFIYMILVFITQIVTLAVYSFTNGNQTRRAIVKFAGISIILFYAVYIAYGFYTKGVVVIQDAVIYLFPIAGWLTGMVIGFLGGNILITYILAGLSLVFITSTVFAMIKWKPDYYEDCLLNSENAYHAKQYAKGDKSAQSSIRKRRTLKNIDSIRFSGGSGASTFMYRHIIEFRRSNKLLVFSFSSILYLVLGITAGIVARNTSNGVVFGLFAMVLYLNMFLIGITKLSQELSRQFIYLVPDSPFKKLLYASLSNLFKPLTDGVLLLVPTILIANFPILYGFSLILIFSSVNCIYIGANIIVYAVYGKFSNSFIVIICYYFLCFALLIPATIVGLIFGFVFSSVVLGLLIASVINYCVTLLIVYICRNMVNNIDFK